MSTISRTKIEWCHYTWNPVWGCFNGCEYCYARKIARRFGEQVSDNERGLVNTEFKTEKYVEDIKNFRPVWLESNFIKRFPKKPSVIFVNSMSDWCWWQSEWRTKAMERIDKHPEHMFVILSKSDYPIYITGIQDNYVIVRSHDGRHDIEDHCISFEPVLGMEPVYVDTWLIMGLVTGVKDPYVPDKKYIQDVVQDHRERGVPVFMKDSMRKVWDGELLREFPEQMEEQCRSLKK